MSENPYKVLGVSENASDAEIRKAYLELVKKYHPDKYTNSPLQEAAAEKMKAVNEAYDTLTKHTNGSTVDSEQNWSYRRYSGSGGTYSGAGASEFARAEECIRKSDYTMAKQILDDMETRNARWQFLYGVCMYNMNMYASASTHFESAYRAEPFNSEYRNAYEAVCRPMYNRYGGRRHGGGSDCSTCDICTTLICADCCCECMGGDLIPCC